jgi:hypothetical protein
MGEEAGPSQCYAPAKVVRHLEMTDMPRRPCITKGKCLQGTGKGQVNEKNPQIKEIPEETPDALGVQKWHM